MAANDEAEQRSSKVLTLDTVIESDGANLSVGERSLLSLARALVKDSKVVILDEATWDTQSHILPHSNYYYY